MKKRLLFVIDSLCLGGAEKSLINLLHCLDYSKFEVDLFLLHKGGIFLSLLPPQVRVLEHSKEWTYFQQPLPLSLVNLFFNFRFGTMYHRIAIACKVKINKMTQPLQQQLWCHITSAIPKLNVQYDAAIGYLEKYPNYFIVEKVKAKKKVGWIHSDYTTYGLDSEFDAPYFEHLDYIIGVSDSCVESLKKYFTNISGKLFAIENISSPKLIHEMSNVKVSFEKKCITIVTAARLVKEKGLDLLTEAASMLCKQGYNFKWLILGDGPLREELKETIKGKQLSKHLQLLGAVVNPYPYIKLADIYAQTSLFEGKSISIDEAKILCKPIVATKFPTVYDQIKDGYTGILAEINAQSICEKIKCLIDNPQMRVYLKTNLSQENVDNESKLQRFYSIIV